MIDVIICAYNAHQFIENALLSILKQTIIDKIIITIIDDGSNKPYDEIVKKYKDKALINVIRLRKNHGVGRARQIGLKKTNSKYIIFLDADDNFMGNDVLEKMYKAYEKNDNIKLVSGYAKTGKKITNILGTLSTRMFRRDIIDKYKITFRNFIIAEDFDFMTKYYLVISEDEIKILNDIIYEYHHETNPNSLMHKNGNIVNVSNYLLKVCKSYLKFAKKNGMFRDTKIILSQFWESLYGYPKKYKIENDVQLVIYYKICRKFYNKYHKYIDNNLNPKQTDKDYYNWLKKVLYD